MDAEDRAEVDGELLRARAAAQRLDWKAAHSALVVADRERALDADDLELLATAAFLLGQVEQCLDALRRAYQSHVDGGQPIRAVRCAYWLLFHLNNQRNFAQASGWLGRANRLLDDASEECAEHGYMLLPVAFQSIVSGDFANARGLAERAAQIGRRFGEADLVALALTLEGRTRIYESDPARGLRLLDEAMLCAIDDETSPIAAGTVYCSLIEACLEIHELRRAHEWTEALSAWCARNHGILTFSGQCLVHRAEVMRLHGAWAAAIEEAHQANNYFKRGADGFFAAGAVYEQAEICRERGDFSAAEKAYQQARQLGLEPQPGLALLRLAQGNAEAAQVAIQRVLAETPASPSRTRLLPACVEIMLERGDHLAARAAATELNELADLYQTQALRAMADHAYGAILLAEGDAGGAVAALLRAWRAWRELEAPYPAACVRVRIGLAHRALGDEEAALAELEAARSTFADLGAAADLRRVDGLAAATQTSAPHGLTLRELEVLRLLASGMTNAAIAHDLVVAPKTVDRHVSNIFNKLGVPSRAAATAFAYQHRLV